MAHSGRPGMMVAMRVAYTLEQCWGAVPGGTAVAALRVAEAMEEHDDIRLIGVAGRHPHLPPDPWMPDVPIAYLPIAAPWLYQTWLRVGWPKVERATGPVEVTHATGLIPCPTDAPLVVTLHDLAFVHEPAHFSKHGVRTFMRSLDHIRRHAAMVLCSSQATLDDVSFAGVGDDRLRLVPLGVDVERVAPTEVARVRALYGLPERYLLFVGTVEPRKNLRGLAAAVSMLDEPLPLIVAGADGWGDIDIHDDLRREIDLRFLGFVPSDDLNPLYAGAHVFCYPSEREGYGLPVLEAMAQAIPVVTSVGTATEETAGSAAVLVEPKDPADIARGITEAIARRAELSAKGFARAQKRSWRTTAALTADVYRSLAR